MCKKINSEIGNTRHFDLLIVMALMVLSVYPTYGQVELDSLTKPFQAEINLIGKSHGDSIVLRWAPTTPGAWAYLNEYGYVIERTSFSSGDDFDPSTYRSLANNPIKPLPLEEWEPVVNSGGDKALSAIAAQALYGESFNSTGAKLFEKADEFSNRFSFSLLAADLSTITADALGLRFVDISVEEENHYIYRVYPSIPPENYKIDTAYLVLQNLRTAPIPVPQIQQIYGSENQITISWDKAIHEPLFTAYIIERSDNAGLTFIPLTKVPFINPESDNIVNKTEVFQYKDSVDENYKPYYYRLIGITAFGEKSPPSEEMMDMGRDRTPPPAPTNVESSQIGQGIVQITWEMPNAPADLDGFYIGRGDNLKESFQPIHNDKIPKDSTSFIDFNSDELSGNYYIVAAVDTAGNGNISMVAYAPVIDSIPPSPPVGLKGEIDTTGVVSLQWELGEEIDLAGYMIYYSNSEDHIFAAVNDAPLADTVYSDTIQLKTLTKKVYYKLKAVDTRWNYSEYSGVLELDRPDIVPPTTPTFSNYKYSQEGVWLQWIPSSSSDVAGYELNIFNNKELQRKVFIEKQGDLNLYTYSDQKVEPGNIYSYDVTTVDESGLRSQPSYPVRVKTIDTSSKESINDLTASINATNQFIELSWSYDPDAKLKRFILYRAAEGASFVTYKSLAPEANSFKDHQLRPGIKYDYTIKAVYNTGKQTPFSNIVSAKLD